MELVPILLYGLLLTFVLCYSVVEMYLLVVYLLRRKEQNNRYRKSQELNSDFVPFVTIQLPVYNERYVVERLLDAVVKIDYPKAKMEIQVLDDSDDDSFELAATRVAYWQSQGFQISHMRRPSRAGFKAGALEYGFRHSKGEFIAIFDADFIPPFDFLKRSIPLFTDPKVGVVQTRWGHLNKDYSLLSRLQAFALDAHFSIEQVGRGAGGHFINFNGTAGVWRKSCIEDAGGWSADTLTEDLDLSYRAQLKAWKFEYLEELVCPAELPVQMNALKAQQFRWSKGAAECARKNLGKVLRSSKLGAGTKLTALFHLMNSFLFICIVLIGLMTYPVILISQAFPQHEGLYAWMSVYYLSIVFLTVFYGAAYFTNAKNKVLAVFEFLFLYPLFLSVSMGLSLYNAIGVLEGYSGKKSAFVRTPKFNVMGKQGTWVKNAYAIRRLPLVIWLEILLSLVFIGVVILLVKENNRVALPFFGMLSFGFLFVSLTGMLHRRA
jgi:cellulose synthase/poly-beta-1,6-N-acetylglucosamine synthase-like glycosyltransferase